MASKPYRYAAVAAGIIAVAVLFTMPGEAYGQEGDSGPAVMKDIGTGPGLDASATPEILKHVGIEQRIGVSLPLDLEFNDETGAPVSLGSYFGDKPVILTLVYYDCPMLCTEVLNGLNRSLAPLNYSIGEEFKVVTVSFDPRESPTLASQKKAVYHAALRAARHRGRLAFPHGRSGGDRRADGIRRLQLRL